MTDKNRILGEGSYGSVVVKNGYAVKSFDELIYLIQEVVAGIHLSGKDHVIQVINADFRQMQLTMKLYSKDLSKWLRDIMQRSLNGEASKLVPLKKEIARQILKGLIEIHSEHLVHGDIKPNNIFVDYKSDNDFYIVIGDVGFVSLHPFAKCERTARAYRDQNPRSCFGHDTYSAGIILLELFADIKIRTVKVEPPQIDPRTKRPMTRPASSEELIEAVHETIKPPTPQEKEFYLKLKSILCRMFNPVHQERPLICDIYRELFGGKKFIWHDIKSNFVVAKEYPEIRGYMLKLVDQYRVERSSRGYKALTAYLEKNPSVYSKYGPKICAATMIVILSGLFMKKAIFREDKAARFCNCKEEIIVRLSEKLCLDTNVVNCLMTP